MTGRIKWLALMAALLLASVVLLNCSGGRNAAGGLADLQPQPQQPVVVIPEAPVTSYPNAGELTDGAVFDLDKTLKELAAYPAPEGVDPDVFRQLKQALSHQLIARQHDKAIASVPTTSSGYVGDLRLSNDNELSWTFVNTGDYDHNSEVSISDITPIGLFYGALISDADWEFARAADGDGNGEVNLADITPIGLNYGHVVTEYNVYASVDHLDHPNNNDGENGAGAALAGTSALDSADAVPVPGGIEFRYMIPNPVADDFYWLRPSDGTADGIASNLVGGNSVLLPLLSLTNPPAQGDGSQEYPYILNDQAVYVFELTDPAVGDITHHIQTEYSVFPSSAGSIETTDATLDIRDGFLGNLIVQAWYQGKPNRSDTTVHCYIPSNAEGFGITGVTPLDGGSGTLVIFTAMVTAGDPLTDEYAWDFGAGASPSISDDRNPECVLEATGTYDCSVTVTNSDGSQADTLDFTLLVTPTSDPPEIIRLTPRYQAQKMTGELYVGSGVLQDVHALATGTRPITYAWNFAGGATPNSFDWSPDHVMVTIMPADTWPADPFVFADALVNVENAFGEDGLPFDLVVEQPPTFYSGSGIMFWGLPGEQKVFTLELKGGSYPLDFDWNYGGGAVPNSQPQHYEDEDDIADTWPAILSDAGEYDGMAVVSNKYADIAAPFNLYVGVPKIRSVTPTQGNEGEELAFSGVIIGADEAPDLDPQWSWQFGGGATPNTSNAPSPMVLSNGDGNFECSLEFTNKHGSDLFEFNLVIQDSPIADVTATPELCQPGTEVSFDASGSTDSDGEIVRYDWDLDGDGGFEILDGLSLQSRTYFNPGATTITVRVWDDDEAFGTAATEIRVYAPSDILQVFISFDGQESWPVDSEDRFIVLISEFSVDDETGNAEPFAPELISLVPLVEYSFDPGVYVSPPANWILWHVTGGGGLAEVGNTAGSRGELTFKDRGFITVEAQVAGDWDKTATAEFALHSVESLELIIEGVGPGPVTVNSGTSVQFEVSGVFDADNLINGNEVDQLLTEYCAWGSLPDAGNTGYFIVLPAGGRLDTSQAVSGDSAQFTCEYPPTSPITIHDNQKRSSGYVRVNIQ